MPISTVTVKINGQTYTLDDNGDGTYSKSLTAPSKTSYNINSGHYYPVEVTATNVAGTATVVDDTHSTLGEYCKLVVREITAPTITITQPTGGSYLASATPTIKFNVVEEADGSGVAISTLKIKVDGNTYTNTSAGVTVAAIANGYSVTIVPSNVLSDGKHTLTIEVSDNDGNKAVSSVVEFTTDTVAPTLTVTNPLVSGSYTSSSELVVSGTASDSTSGTPTVTVKLNNGANESVTVSNGVFNKIVTLSSGSNTIVITATDKAGKVTTITRTIILDTSSPVVASVNITPNPVNVGGSYTVTVTVS